jgi:hypothetical protein
MTFLSRRRARAAVAARLVPNLSVSALSALILAGYAVPFSARAQIAATPRPVLEEQRQQERERAIREQQERTVDTRLPRQAAPDSQPARQRNPVFPYRSRPAFRRELR